MSIYAQIAAVLIALIVAAGGGVRVGLKLKQGEWDAARVASTETMQAAQAGAAEAIAKLEVKNVTIRQAVQREVVTKEVFRDCRSGPIALGLLNSAAGASSPAAGASDVPGSGGAD